MPDIGFEFRWVDPRDLLPNPRNPRRLGREGMAKLERAIKEWGFTTPAVVQASSGMLIAGHQRTRAAIAVGLERIPTVWADVDDAMAEKIMLADNRLGEEAEWDSDRLAEIFASVGGDVATLAGFTDDEFAAVLETWSTQVAEHGRTTRTVVDWDRLALFYHVASPAHIGVVPGLNQAVPWTEAGRWMRGRGTRLLLLADSALGVDRRGTLWGSTEDQLAIAAVAVDAMADLAEAPGIPLTPAVLRDFGMGRAEALERHAEIAVQAAPAFYVPQLWRLPGEAADHAVVLEAIAGHVSEEDVLGVEVGSDPGLAYAAVAAVVKAGVAPVHLCAVSDPRVAAAGLAAGAVSLDSPAASASGWDQLVVPVRRIDGSFATKRLRFEELLSTGLAPTGRLRDGLALAHWITGALMFEATLAIETGATKEVPL